MCQKPINTNISAAASQPSFAHRAEDCHRPSIIPGSNTQHVARLYFATDRPPTCRPGATITIKRGRLGFPIITPPLHLVRVIFRLTGLTFLSLPFSSGSLLAHATSRSVIRAVTDWPDTWRQRHILVDTERMNGRGSGGGLELELDGAFAPSK